MKDKKEKSAKDSSRSRRSSDGKDAELKPTKKLLSFTRSKKKSTQELESLKLPDLSEFRDLIEDGDDLKPLEDGETLAHLLREAYT